MNQEHGEMIEELVQNFGYIKVNLPSSIEDYKTGNGEGMWAVVASQEDFDIEQAEVEGTKFKVYLCNDSFYYPDDYPWGSEVIAESRGSEYRAVAVWEELSKIGRDLAEKNREDTIRLVAMHQMLNNSEAENVQELLDDLEGEDDAES